MDEIELDDLNHVVSLEHYDQCRAEIIAWAESQSWFFIEQIPLVDSVSATTRAAVLLDLIDSGAIFTPADKLGFFRLWESHRLQITPRRCLKELRALLPNVQSRQGYTYKTDEPLTPKAHRKRLERLERIMEEQWERNTI